MVSISGCLHITATEKNTQGCEQVVKIHYINIPNMWSHLYLISDHNRRVTKHMVKWYQPTTGPTTSSPLNKFPVHWHLQRPHYDPGNVSSSPEGSHERFVAAAPPRTVLLSFHGLGTRFTWAAKARNPTLEIWADGLGDGCLPHVFSIRLLQNLFWPLFLPVGI